MNHEVVVVSTYTEIPHPDIGRFWVFPSAEMTAAGAAEQILDLVRGNPKAVISYATGETMVPVYEALVQRAREMGLSFSQTWAFQGDDYYPADPDRDGFSFTRYLRKRVFGPLGLQPDRIFEINGLAPDSEAEALRYDQLLREYLVDLTILGIGPGGHIYFNEPGTPFSQRMWVADFSQATLDRDRVERRQNTPGRSLTQGIGNILESRQILLVAYGARKGDWLREALYGQQVGPSCPASALRLVGDKVTIIVDQEAGGVIRG